MTPPTRDDILAAARRIAGHVRRTPLLEDAGLNALAGRRVLLKCENLQHTGSFKARGGWNAVARLCEGDRPAAILAMSSGNHAQGVARAAAAHGIPCTVVMPADAPAAKLAATEAHGARIVTYDRAREDRDALAARIARDTGAVLIPPFDHPDVIAGQGTAGLEIAEQAAGAGAAGAEIVVCAGGGGFAAGIALATEGARRVRTAEPEGFDDLARSLAAGERLSNAATSGSICDAVLTPCPGAITFPVLARLAGPGLVVTDAEALRAVRHAFERLRLVVEPGGAVALAAALFRPDLPETVIVTLSGGNVDPALFARAIAA
ncbi:MAG: threonine ammonia-lyase [Hasllibacter sp.]